MKKLKALTHPIPKNFAERIYNQNKTVFVGKSYLGKVSIGDKLVIYESRGEKAYTGWADIKSIKKMNPNDILKVYEDELIVTREEFRDYSHGRKWMTVIEFKNFKKFNKAVKPKRFVSISGKYIYEDEYNFIDKNKG